MSTVDRRISVVRVDDSSRPKSSTKAKRLNTPSETLQSKFKICDIPEDVLEKCFKYFSKVSPKCVEEVSLWGVKQALLAAEQDLSEDESRLARVASSGTRLSAGRDSPKQSPAFIPSALKLACISEEKILEMVSDIGKIEHEGLKINFREFCLVCWRNLIQKDDEGLDEVREAFQILGGNSDGSVAVDIEQLKAFAHRSELSIDIERFVADVDDDQSGMVDYKEFRQLFDGSLDTAQLFADDSWLRTDAEPGSNYRSQSRLRTRPSAVAVDAADGHGGPAVAASPQQAFTISGAIGRTESLASTLPPPPSRTSALFRPPLESPGIWSAAAEHADHHARSGSRRDAVAGQAAAPAPVVAKRRRFEVSRMTCRRGWRVNACHCNMPGVEGYNTYCADRAPHADLAAAVRLRGRGGEWALREAAATRLRSRPPTEERCRKVPAYDDSEWSC